MAGAGGATVQVDKDADNVFETHVLAEGQALLIDGGMRVGGRVLSDRPVQVDLITGDVGSYYESRFMRLLPTAYWSSSQATPVATSSTAGTTVWLYNPGSTSIDLLYVRRASGNLTTNTLTVAAGGYRKRQLETSASGARFINVDENPFYALATVDSFGDSGANHTYDWGFALVPESSLTPQVLVGLGIGRDPTSSTNPQENGSPVWVTPIGNGETEVWIYVDYDSDPNTGAYTDPDGNKYDVRYSVKELQQQKIYNPGGNQSGMLIYVLDSKVKLAAAWGSDLAQASTGSPGLDFGTGIPPFPLYVANKYSELVVDADSDGHISPGDTLRYSIVIENTGRQPVIGLDLEDILPAGLTYLENNAFFVDENSITTQIADNALSSHDTIFPLDEGGIDLPKNVLPVRSSWAVRYTVMVDAYDALPAGTVSLQNTAKVGGSGLTITNSIVNFIHGRVGDYLWWDKNENGLQDDGEPGVNGAIVSLLDENGVAVLGVDGHPVTTVTSNDTQGVKGYYRFAGVKAGDYRVVFTPPEQYLLTIVNSDGLGVGGTKNSDADPTTGRTEVFTVAGGEIRADIDAGLIEKPSCVAGTILLDVNGNGVVDPEDIQGLAGVTVKLVDTNSQVVATTTTGATGRYRFESVYSGEYTLVQMLPGGYTNTYDVAGENDLRIPVTLLAGVCTLNQDFYNTRTAGGAIGNKVLYLSGVDQMLDRVDPVAEGRSDTATVSLAAPVVGAQAITVVGDPASSTSGQTVSSHSFAYNSGSADDNRILMVGVSYRNTDNESVSAVSYAGQTMVEVGTRANGTNGRIAIYRLLDPPTGSHSLLVSWSSRLDQGAVVGAVTYAGVNQTTPTGTFASSSGNSTSPGVTVSSGTDQLVFGVVGGRTSYRNYSAADGGTQLWSERPFNGTAGSGQSKAGAASSVTLSWSGSTWRSYQWMAGGVSLNPAPAVNDGSYATFTQAPEFALPFTMQTNATISITNYINVTSGAMPANPDVTAYLSVDGSPFMILSDPVYDGSRLVWSGAPQGDVNLAAGQSIALSVLNEQSGVAFDIRYNSSTYPSRVVLPTPSIIEVPSLGIYNAPYPGGMLVTESPIGAQRFVRLTVTDPFGAYDITGVDLTVDGPGTAGDLTLTLNDGDVVASNAWSKTYETLWNTVSLEGDYAITATAREGSEGITASGASGHQLYVPSARLYGYAYQDKDNVLMRTGSSGSASGMVVQVWFEGQMVASTNANAEGYYTFDDLRPGTYEIRFMGSTEHLTKVPKEGAAANDPERNRAVASQDGYATVTYELYSGHGIGDDSGEPVNAGFTGTGPMSSGIDLRAYRGADGVYVEFIAHDVEQEGRITLFLVDAAGNEIWSDRVAVQAGDQRLCRFKAPGLIAGKAYDFRVRDEVGKLWSASGVKVGEFATEMIEMTLEGITLAFDSLPDREYEIQWTPRLGQSWQSVTNVLAESEKTTLLVEHPDSTSPSGFFRIRMK